MGAVKHYKAMMDDLRAEAEGVAVAAKAVKPCKRHEDVLLDQYDPAALDLAYRIANSRISKGEIKLPAGFKREDFTDLVKDVVNSSGDECYSCENMFGKD